MTCHKTTLADRPLSYNVTPEEMFDLFGKFGPIRYDERKWGRYPEYIRLKLRAVKYVKA